MRGGPGYGYYDYGPGYYGAGYYGGPYAYDAPYRWGGSYATTYYTAPVCRIVRPAYAYYGGAYPVVRHRWHHHHW